MEGGKLARRLLLLRSWERQHMPMAGSIIAGDIVLLRCLRYGEDRVSQVLKELVRDGWLTMERDEADRRMRQVHASDRLVLLFGECQRSLIELLVGRTNKRWQNNRGPAMMLTRDLRTPTSGTAYASTRSTHPDDNERYA